MLDGIVFFGSSGFLYSHRKKKCIHQTVFFFCLFRFVVFQVFHIFEASLRRSDSLVDAQLSKAQQLDIVRDVRALDARSQLKSVIFIGLRFYQYFLQICSNYY